MPNLKTIIKLPEATVITEFNPVSEKTTSYQTEMQLENAFIELLKEQSYEYLKNIHSEKDLISNLRKQIEKINNYTFTDTEWELFFKNELANEKDGIKEKTEKIQSADGLLSLKKEWRKNGLESKNIKIIDKNNIHNNILQVINQYETTGTQKNRYDVTILVNGLPLIHTELKKRGVDLREAFNQIKRYNRESFWADCGLFEYVQLFIISNGTLTKYYSNTTRDQHIKDEEKGKNQTGKKTSNSFEFTSWWASAKNERIADLMDFTKTFLAKHTILNVLFKYCVFTCDKMLMVMRPYQIVATEKILEKIKIATNYSKKLGTVEAGGYIWHTTGSGKTLTSFKTAQLASKLKEIDKVLFVVDRKDLDYQTIKEYDKYEKGAANSNVNTRILQSQLENVDTKIIITTIQKLDRFISTNRKHQIYNQHIVLIFDECHRSQFGEFHKNITKNFKKYHIFGFTGTPIFPTNSSANRNINLRTTKQAFGDELHSYTIVDAIQDNNVLPFRIDINNTIKEKENIIDIQIKDIDKKAAFTSSKRINAITKYIFENFDTKTYRNKYFYENNEQKRLNGFNSILCCDSIDMAKKYYLAFKMLNQENKNKQLKVATIFSYVKNNTSPEDEIITDEGVSDDDVNNLSKDDRDFLENLIIDYNSMFKTNYTTSLFENYYKDISQRMKNRELDILIVVNMFLTGFDATTLNTLWVDKQLVQHSLLQAFSRTNRILNSIKTFGNIVCFRNLSKQIDDAISLFGDKKSKGIIIIKTFNEYYNGYDEDGKHIKGYVELMDDLKQMYPNPSTPLRGEENQKKFISLFGGIKKILNILNVFDEFTSDKKALAEVTLQDYQSVYLDLYHKYHNKSEADKTNINGDIVFEIELIKQTEIGIDYILKLIEQIPNSVYENKEHLIKINKLINSSPTLRSKKELIEQFIASLKEQKEEWSQFVEKTKKQDLDKIIEQENLNKEATYSYMEASFRDGTIKTNGVAINRIFKKTPSRFDKANQLVKLKNKIIDKLLAFFEKYFDISNQTIED